MSKVTVEQFAKLMADPKVSKILQATKVGAGLTPKEISKATKIPNNQLYYTLNKMLDADLLTIVKQEKVKNLTENYYSSTHIGQKSKNAPQNDEHTLNFSNDWIQKHAEETIQLVMVEHHDFIEALKAEIGRNSNDSKTFSSHGEYDLSPEGEKKLITELFKLLNDAEENDPNPDSTEKHHIKIQLEKW